MPELFEQTWWNKNLKNKSRYNDYRGWLGDLNAPSRVFIRENIQDMGIKSIADFGCGPCLEYIGLKENGYKFDYLGIDSCIHLKEENESKGINFINKPIEETGLEDNSYELSYSRHVYEHLPTYKDALTEMIRVASKYVVHIFFITPTEEEEKINYWPEENLYHNVYQKSDIESFLNENSKVESFEWLDITEKETAIVITLKE